MEGQSDEQSSREMRNDGKQAMDRDRHGERMRHREGRFRYFHDGYYYATPWWTTGVVVDGGGASVAEKARGLRRVAASTGSSRLIAAGTFIPIEAGAVASLGVSGLIPTVVESSPFGRLAKF